MPALVKSKQIFVHSLFLAIILFVFHYYPANNPLQQIIVSAVLLLLVPIAYWKIIQKKSLRSLGLRAGDWRNGLKWSLYCLVISIAAWFFLVGFTDILREYSLPVAAMSRFSSFLAYEFFGLALVATIYGSFHYGFILSAYSPILGYGAIILQGIIYCLLVALSGSSFYQAAPFFIFSFFGGLIAYKSRSIVYPIMSQWFLVLLIDTMVIRSLK